MRDTHNASASLAGYLYQCRLALLLGLQRVKKRPGEQVSIEKFDDVSFDTDDLATCLIQAKHHGAAKSISDSSVDIWKTLRIWIADFQRGTLTGSDVRYILITTAQAQDGSAMSHLRPSRTVEDVEAACALLVTAAKNYEAKASEVSRKAFLSLSPSDQRLLLARIDVLDLQPNLTNVRGEIESELLILSPDNVEQIADDLEGWWFSRVAERLIVEGGATIPLQDIIRKAHDIGSKYMDARLPVEDPNSLGAPDYTSADERLVFVRQMRAVNFPDRGILRSVQDFYRASAQRSRWAREALLLDGETAKYDMKLLDRFERRRDELFDASSPGTPDEKERFGRNLCHWASQEEVQFRDVVETWITSGSFHGLADRSRLGWHPDYAIMFPRSEDNND